MCFSLTLLLFLLPVPDFDSIASVLTLIPLPRHLLVLLNLWRNPIIKGVCACVSLCVCVFRRGVYPGLPPPPPPPPSVTQPVGVTRMADWVWRAWKCCLLPHEEKVLIYNVFGLKLVNIAIKNFKCLYRGGGGQGGMGASALSLRRGLLCSVFQCFVVAILILNYNCG